MKIRFHTKVPSGRVIDWAERGRTKRLRKKYRSAAIVCGYEARKHGGARILAWYGDHMRDVGHVQFGWWSARARLVGLNNNCDINIDDMDDLGNQILARIESLIRGHISGWKQTPGVFMSPCWALPVFSVEDYEYYRTWNTLKFHVARDASKI